MLGLFMFRPISPESCVSLIKQCGNVKALKSVHASMVKSHLHLNVFFATKLISQYSFLGYVSYAYTIFSESKTTSLDVFLWNVMIQGFADNGDYKRSVTLYSQMRELGIVPDNFTFPIAVKSCGYLRDLRFGVQIHRDMIQLGYNLDIYACNSLITMYGKCHRVDISSQLFDKMPVRNIVTWSSMIGAYSQSGRYDDGMTLFLQMIKEKITPNRGTIMNVIECVSSESEANDVYKVVIDNGLNLDLSVQNASMRMYTRCGRIDIARKIFDGTPCKDLVCWTSIIEAYAHADLSFEALEIYKHMTFDGVLPDSVTILSLIRACSASPSFIQARAIHGYVTKIIRGNQLSIDTALVDFFVKCGSINYARNVFESMKERNLISWSTMISGYGMHGYGKEALSLFEEMKKSDKPDHITFTSILSACSHCGLISEGLECFNSMVNDYGITPSSEHYACVVDMLGRFGNLNDAMDFIEKMWIKPEVGVWGALLGACRIHSNVEFAEKAAKRLIDLDPENPGRYVILSNIYSSSSKINEADQIRSVMKNRGVMKVAGHAELN